MERKEKEMLDKICNTQNFDEILLDVTKQKRIKLNKILTEISKDNRIDEKLKRTIYEDFYDYVIEVNKSYISSIENVYRLGAENAINEIYKNEKGMKIIMENQARIIIADDNIHICKFIKNYLSKYEDIEILGEAYTDEEEVKMIEELKPDVVITDLVRNHKYTGLDIIKDYYNKKSNVKFLVISADRKEDVIRDGLEVAGYIKKPFTDYEIIYDELVRIKKEIS